MWSSIAALSGSPSLKVAQLEFLRGNYEPALQNIAKIQSNDPEHVLFAAHMLNRMRRRAESVQQIETARAAGLLTFHEHGALASAIEAAGLASIGRVADARAALTSVVTSKTFKERRLGEIAYYVALTHWTLQNADEAEASLDAFDPSFDANLHARYEFLRGWICGLREQYAEQLQANRRATALLESGNTFPDVGLWAQVARSTAALTRDLIAAEPVAVVSRMESAIPWTPDLALERFHVMRLIAWSHAMDGDVIPAIRALNGAKQIAPTDHARMLSHLDHAWVAKISNEPLHQRAELLEADACAVRVDWEHAADEEAGALVLAAELYADVDPTMALSYFEKAVHARKTMSKSMALSHDQRMAAYQDYADALIREATGQRAVAKHRAERAQRTFAGIGYTWRAAACALLLYRLSGDAESLHAANIVAEVYPRSFVSTEVARAKRKQKDASPFLHLTKRQKQIVALIQRGLQNDAVAERLNLSPNTVRVHKTKIFRLFNVGSEFELLNRLKGSAA